VTAALVLPVVLSMAMTLYAMQSMWAATSESSYNFGVTLGVVGLISTLFNMWWLNGLWHKIPVTSLALSLSSHVIFQLPATMVVATCAVALQLVWAGVAFVAAQNVYAMVAANYDLDDGEGHGVLALVFTPLLVTAYWGWQVLFNVSYVTTCACVGAWYFEPSTIERGAFCCKPVVCESLGRSLTSSFGSICCGSLLVAIVQAICTTLKGMEAKAREEGNMLFIVVTCCFRCLFSFLEALLEMFNEWAFVYVAIYGTSFTTAGRAVYRLVEQEGLTTVLAGLVADTVLGYGAFFAGLVGTAVASAVTLVLWPTKEMWPADGSAWTSGESIPSELPMGVGLLLVGVPALVLSSMLGSTCLSPVRAAIRTTLVCFAEAPSVLRAREPGLHAAFADVQAKPDPEAAVAPTAVGVRVATGAPMM
jgi:hypothetical protein